MWKPRYIVTKAPHVGGASIPDDEPCLVIRGQDELALKVLDYYMNTYLGSEFFDRKVYEELADHRHVLAEWRRTHRDKIKTADR